MKAYFPIPPNITIPKYKEKIFGSITFLNTPNNRLKSIFSNKNYNVIVFLGIYHLKNKAWNLLKVIKCYPLEFVEISRKEFMIKDNEMIVVITRKTNSFKKETEILPEPDSLRIDNSTVAQRVAINFSFLKSTSSYQGEYPLGMASIKKSSFLTFDTLKGLNDINKKNFLILMNISKKYTSSDPVEVKIFNPKDKSNYKLLIAKRNYSSIFETVEYEKEFKEKETIFLTSNVCTFVPIILSVDLKTTQLSVEHMHPPSEFFNASNKQELIKITKNQWLT